jgi:hypothetical protein
MRRIAAAGILKALTVAIGVAAILAIFGFCIWLSAVDKSYADYMANKWSGPLACGAFIALALIVVAGRISDGKPVALLLALAWGMGHAGWLLHSAMKATTAEILQNMACGLGTTLIITMIITSCNPREWKGIVFRVLVPFGVMCPFWIHPQMIIVAAGGCSLCIGGGWLASRIACNITGSRAVKTEEPSS